MAMGRVMSLHEFQVGGHIDFDSHVPFELDDEVKTLHAYFGLKGA